jgi:2-polyprenyl-3-methyl-5-hydroxy-6-metoxy-1,4-benzoquinol methylase
MNCLNEIRATGEILDYGAGTGNLTQLLYDSNLFQRIAAVDIIQRPRDLDSSIDWYTHDLNEPTSFPDKSFDVIVSAEVIEHLENPRATAREWHRLLRPGGLLVFSTPNNQSIRSLIALVVRGHFVAFGSSSYPAHITALLRKDMERVVAEAGLTAPSFRYTNVGGIPGRPNVRWQSLLGSLARGSLFSDNVICVARRPTNAG